MSINAYRWNQMPLAGPRSFVISHDHTCEGPVATSSGLIFAGWDASRRRSRVCPAALAIRYMLDMEQRYRSSSSSRAQICQIDKSAYCSELITARTSARSSSDSVEGGFARSAWGTGVALADGGFTRR